MIESGLNQFYYDIARLKTRIAAIRKKQEDEQSENDPIMVKTLGLEQLSMFFVLYAVQIIFAIGVLIIELIVHHFGLLLNAENIFEFV